MKAIIFFLFILVNSCVSGKEIKYTASTPAGKTVRSFLGISQTDSIDFIRWNLKISNLKEFDLSCSYGIGKPNTNGFIDEKKVELKGKLTYADAVYTLTVDGRSLSLLGLNYNVLHILNGDKTMMVGNGGWSYTLNSLKKIQTKEINLKSKPTMFKDSIVFEGRTPCKNMNEMFELERSNECYKIKWLIVLYKDGASASSGTYKMGARGAKKGNWKMKENNEGRIIYSLDLGNGHTLDLLHTDENIAYFLDDNGGLLVGDLDFSYSLNRRKR